MCNATLEIPGMASGGWVGTSAMSTSASARLSQYAGSSRAALSSAYCRRLPKRPPRTTVGRNSPKPLMMKNTSITFPRRPQITTSGVVPRCRRNPAAPNRCSATTPRIA